MFYPTYANSLTDSLGKITARVLMTRKKVKLINAFLPTSSSLTAECILQQKSFSDCLQVCMQYFLLEILNIWVICNVSLEVSLVFKLLLLEIIGESVLHVSIRAGEEGEDDISFILSNSLLAASSFPVYS